MQHESRLRRIESAGDQLYFQQNYEPALGLFLEALRLGPQSTTIHYKVASAAWKAGQPRLVELHLLEAVRIDPRHAWAHEGLGLWYLNRDRLEPALRHSAAALELEPRNVHFIVSRAFVLAADRKPEEAWQLLAPVLADPLAGDRAATLYARIAPDIGHEQQAAAWATSRINDGAGDRSDRRHLHFAAANLLDKMGRYDEAFEQAALAQQMASGRRSLDVRTVEMAAKIDRCTAARIRSWPRATHASARPVFIVGMPRSGTSLIEQVLASHPDVFGAGELDYLPRLANDLHIERPTPKESFEPLSTAEADAVAGQYLLALEALNPTAKCVTDKQSTNFMYLDLVQVLFPDSHIIHCLRDPVDTCLSCFMTDMDAGEEFPFGDLRQLGVFYRQYRWLMDHWKQVLNVRMIEVRYEELVTDLEGHTRRLLEFLGLPWDRQCLEFYKNTRPVLTASREQVRRPIYASSVGRAAHYRKHLSELINSLA